MDTQYIFFLYNHVFPELITLTSDVYHHCDVAKFILYYFNFSYVCIDFNLSL